MCADYHSTTLIGIDPGLTGAVAILSAEGTLLALHDVPVLSLKVQRGHKQAYDVPGMVELLRPYAEEHAHVLIEESQPMPGQGTRSMFTIGLGYGLWIAMLATLQLPYTSVRPAQWKRSLALGTDKEASRLRAMQLSTLVLTCGSRNIMAELRHCYWQRTGYDCTPRRPRGRRSYLCGPHKRSKNQADPGVATAFRAGPRGGRRDACRLSVCRH